MASVPHVSNGVKDGLSIAKTPAVRSRLFSDRHIPALDGLRGLAILAVFFYHYGAGGVKSTSTAVRCLATIAGLGWSGVDLFFVLSGFLITGILYDGQHSSWYYRNFYVRRALRIFPIYYLFIAITLFLIPLHLLRGQHLFFLAYLGFPAAVIWPTLVNLPVRITHLWSLSIEEQFYWVWPWLIRACRTPRRILGLCGFTGLVAFTARMVVPEPWANTALPCRMDDLAVGAALAIILRGDLQHLCMKHAWGLFSFASTAAALVFLLRHTTERTDYLVYTLGFTLVALACGGLLLLSMGPLSPIFSQPVLRIFGKYSYGMYLYHFPLTIVTERAKPFFTHFPFSELSYVALSMTVNLAIAALSFHFVEEPILRLKKRFGQ
jgi:peptidoglycan/LPS O-acetylase OafA/YrhL